MTDVAGLHPAVAVLAPLLGRWAGRGSGEYPTIEPFGYTEDITFGHIGKPFLTYSQRTRSDDGTPLHAETGYLRVPAPGRVELIVAQPTGITEVDEGSVTADDGELVIEIASTAIGLSNSAKDVAALTRSIHVEGNELSYTLQMAAAGLPLQHHLSATLHRQR